MRLALCAIAGTLAAQLAPALALAGEIDAAAEFGPCLACHSLDASNTGLPGPSLADLKGRRLGGDPDFSYSPVFREAHDTGAAWDEALLNRFLTDPEGMFPGMWMSYPGVEDADTRSALIKYIFKGGKLTD